jgi:propanediol dehydratase small subunit
MSSPKLTAADYPLAEKRPELVQGKRGKTIDAISLDGLMSGDVTLEDLSITKRALNQQAEIARDAGRATLAQNFERAADIVDVPQEAIMRVYELLRPGRAESKAQLVAAAEELESKFGASTMAAFIKEAAGVYEKRGLFRRRY